MKLVGENINIMSHTLGPAMKERNPAPIIEMVRAEDKSGVDYLDLNIGPARKAGDELMSWLVETVQDVTSKSLSLDTTNAEAMKAGLKTARQRPLVNSVSLQPERLEKALPLVKEHNADMIGLLWGVEGMPRDANERCMLTVDLLIKTAESGIANEDVWIDPIVTPVSVEINQVRSCIEFMSMLAAIAPGCKSIVGLSNVSNGTPNNLRPILNRTYMIMLMKHGLYSAIVDAFDEELIKIAHGQMPQLVKLIHDMMDGYEPDIETLNPKEKDYAKSYQILSGQKLYSHSWLDI